MSQFYRYGVITVLVSLTLACGLITRIGSNEVSSPSIPSQTIITSASTEAANTPVATKIIKISSTSTQSNGSGLSIPSELTSTPGISSTFSSFIAMQTMMVGTAFAQMGPSAHLSGYLIFYSNPVGTPVQTWHNVPIMTQATAGQEFQSDIYSYKAAATLAQGTQFYSSKQSSLNWSCTIATGYGGSGTNKTHSSTFVCRGFTIIVTSFDNNPKNILVVINKVP